MGFAHQDIRAHQKKSPLSSCYTVRSKKHSSSTGVITLRLNIFTASAHYFHNNRPYENPTTTSQTLQTMMVTGATIACVLP